MKTGHEFPRRMNLSLLTDAELSIFRAMQEVEKAGADERLTEAVILLDKAKNYVSDFVDGIKKFPPANVCSCTPEQGEEIGWIQKRHCNKCDKVI